MGNLVNLMLGLWLAVSPFIFRFPEDVTVWWTHDIAVGLGIAIFSCFAAWRPTEHARFIVLMIAVWLVLGSLALFDHPRPPMAQNRILLGWLLAMFGVLPREVFRPPEGWRSRVDEPGRERR